MEAVLTVAEAANDATDPIGTVRMLNHKGKQVAMTVVEVMCNGIHKIWIPVNLGDLGGSRGWVDALESHMKRFRPNQYRQLKKSGELEKWMYKQVDDLQEEFQSMILTMGGDKAAAIEELLLPQYIYLTPEPGFENRD